MFSRELFWKLYYRIRESGEFVLVESEILGFGIRNPESLKIRVRNSSYTDKDSGIQYLESGIHKRGILNRGELKCNLIFQMEDTESVFSREK